MLFVVRFRVYQETKHSFEILFVSIKSLMNSIALYKSRKLLGMKLWCECYSPNVT